MKKNEQLGLFIAAMVGIGLLLYSLLMTIPAAGRDVAQTPTNSDPIAARNLSEIEFYKKQLENKDLSEADRNSLKAKLMYAQREATQRVINLREIEIQETSGIRETIIAQQTRSPRPVSTDSPRFTGLWQETEIPPNGRYTVGTILTSLWFGENAGRYYRIYSGALFSDPTQGTILVQIDKPFSFYKILAPNRTGGLKIISEKNKVLTLETEMKEILYFDVLTLHFVNSLEEAMQSGRLTPTPLKAYP